MRNFIAVKMKEYAQEWLRAKADAVIVTNEQAQDISEGFEQSLMDSVEDFHQFFFTHFDEAISAFDPYSQRHIRVLLSLSLEEWTDQGLLEWDAFRLFITPAGKEALGHLSVAA